MGWGDLLRATVLEYVLLIGIGLSLPSEEATFAAAAAAEKSCHFIFGVWRRERFRYLYLY
jgi:hypothetical protein